MRAFGDPDVWISDNWFFVVLKVYVNMLLCSIDALTKYYLTAAKQVK